MRFVYKIFDEQIGKTIEVYMGNMLVKSIKETEHLTHLNKMFGILKKHKMMANLAKCTFRVSWENFLSFMVNQ